MLLYINKLKNNNNSDPQTIFTEKFIFQTRDKVMDQQTTLYSYTGQSIYTLIQPTPSLALPSYVLPLNFDFASVLGLAIQYVSQILQVNF